MNYTEDLQIDEMDEAALRAWDWRASLRAEERSCAWLGRQTGKSQRTVFAYSYGELVPPIAWLRAAAQALRIEVAA